MFKIIKGYESYMINENGIIINKKGHVMSPVDVNGYLRYALEVYDDNGKLLHRDNLFAHRLVAENFIPNPENLPIVMHKDNDKKHTHYTNLKWGTHLENNIQAIEDGIKTFRSRKYVYEVYNDDRSVVYRCNGKQGVADLIGFNYTSIRPGTVKSGEYEGYIIEKTGEKVRPLVSFTKANIN